jgi:thiol-disulfide isomerase/thioredoxin
MKTTSLPASLRRLLLAAAMLMPLAVPARAQLTDQVLVAGPVLLSPQQLQLLISRMLGRQGVAQRRSAAARATSNHPAAWSSGSVRAAPPATSAGPSPTVQAANPAPVAQPLPAQAQPAPTPAMAAQDPDRPEIRFTAVDGREVDLASLRGKVVLIDFWSTWCGPCVREIPNVVNAYREFHDRGFEVIGISFDTNRAALERMVSSKDMPWPQHFDGKGWKNEFGLKFGIRSLPTMWLIDDEGRIVTRNARGDLAGRVRRLLEAAGR